MLVEFMVGVLDAVAFGGWVRCSVVGSLVGILVVFWLCWVGNVGGVVLGDRFDAGISVYDWGCLWLYVGVVLGVGVMCAFLVEVEWWVRRG